MPQENPAFERLFSEYSQSGKNYDIATHPYYSMGAYRLDVVDMTTLANGDVRAWLVANKNQRVEFFGYGKGDSVEAFGLGKRTATDADTNQAQKNRTNEEDYAIEGISASSRGLRVTFPEANVNAMTQITDPRVRSVLLGSTTMIDPGSTIIPPEVGSPFTLEDTLFEAIRSKVIMTTSWNRKNGDLLGPLGALPEGGGRSYLRSNGEPSHHNFTRIPEGMVWRRTGSGDDTMFAVIAELQHDVVVPITLSPVWQPSGGTKLGPLQSIHLEWCLKLHGRAFAEFSKN